MNVERLMLRLGNSSVQPSKRSESMSMSMNQEGLGLGVSGGRRFRWQLPAGWSLKPYLTVAAGLSQVPGTPRIERYFGMPLIVVDH